MNDVVNTIEKVVESKVRNKESFTAHDILYKVRRLTSSNILFSYVRDYIRDYMENFSMYKCIYNGDHFEYHHELCLPTGYYQLKSQEKLCCPVRSLNRVTIPKDILNKVFGNYLSLKWDGKELKANGFGHLYRRTKGSIRIKIRNPKKKSVTFIIHNDKLELE